MTNNGRLAHEVTARLASSATARLEWVSEDCELFCPVCRCSGPGCRFLIATLEATGRAVGVVHCRQCRSVVPDWFGTTDDLPSAIIDGYVEFFAGVDAMLLTLMRVEPRPGLRFLEVGCGYGFALDLARFAWGWEGIGVDPSRMALRGRDDLRLDIRTTRFDPDLDLGSAAFDVVLASETLEHVPEPLAFLRALRSRLVPGGVLVMSTPNAAFVTPTNPAKDVVAALGLGGHRFLVDGDCLRQLLGDAGFEGVEVQEDAMTLRAVASPTAVGLARCQPTPTGPDFKLLTRYYDARADSAAHRSALRLGMAARYVQCALYANDLTRAEAGCDRLRSALLERHGIDVDDPEMTSELARHSALPMAVAAAHYSVAFLELVARDRPTRAASHFSAAALAASSALSTPSPAPAMLELRAIGHEALALARSDPARVLETLRRLRQATRELMGRDISEIETLCSQAFNELVARGHYAEADAVRSLALPESWRGRDVGPDLSRSRLDLLFFLGILGLHRNRVAEAADYFGLCHRLAESSGEAGLQDLAALAREHEAMALERLESNSASEAGASADGPEPALGHLRSGHPGRIRELARYGYRWLRERAFARRQ